MRKSIFIVVCSLMLVGVTACQPEGPADNAGQSVSDALNPPQGPAQSVGRKVDRALGE
jgi:hypothetical protein